MTTKTVPDLEAEIRVLREMVAAQGKTIEMLLKSPPAPQLVPVPCTRPHRDEMIPYVAPYPYAPVYPSYPYWQIGPTIVGTTMPNAAGCAPAQQALYIQNWETITAFPTGAGAAGCAPVLDFTVMTIGTSGVVS